MEVHFINWRELVTVATPTAAPVADQPTSPSASLEPPSPALPAPYISRRILPIPPAPAGLDEFLIEVPPRL
jgi:hypothetical protein